MFGKNLEKPSKNSRVTQSVYLTDVNAAL